MIVGQPFDKYVSPMLLLCFELVIEQMQCRCLIDFLFTSGIYKRRLLSRLIDMC